MNDELKAVRNLGAELGAAKAENEKLHGLLREVIACQAAHYGDATDLHLAMITLADRLKGALSQQADPAETTEAYTAVDMATAAAQGFRDGQAAVEPAAAQDEQEVAAVIGFYEGEREPRLLSWNVLPNGEHRLYTRLAQTEQQPEQSGLIKALEYYANGNHLLLADPDAWDACSGEPLNFLHDDAGTASVEDGSIARVALEAYRAAPIAQTEQQPAFLLEIGADGEYAVQVRDKDWLRSMRNKREHQTHNLYSALIAQTAPQGKFRMGDLVKKSTGSEWVGRVVGWYSTEQTKEGYAVESSAHRNSVQIYPATALEAVE